jgi:RimJ/RimL family protein N-acetyltransferase
MIVETPRLLLRPPEARDVQAMLEIHQNPEVVRYIGTGVAGDIAVAWRNVAIMIGHWQMLGFGPWIITGKGNGEILGRVGMWDSAGGPGVELGWMLRREAWGKGYATEAARAALDWGWANTDYDYVISLIHEINLPSIRIAEKLGGTVDRTGMVDGAMKLTYGYRRPAGAVGQARNS